MKEIKNTGNLYKNQRGRYELNGTELTCGDRIELYVVGKWVKTRIEHDNNDYYAVGHRDVNLNGIRARIRE